MTCEYASRTIGDSGPFTRCQEPATWRRSGGVGWAPHRCKEHASIGSGPWEPYPPRELGEPGPLTPWDALDG